MGVGFTDPTLQQTSAPPVTEGGQRAPNRAERLVFSEATRWWTSGCDDAPGRAGGQGRSRVPGPALPCPCPSLSANPPGPYPAPAPTPPPHRRSPHLAHLQLEEPPLLLHLLGNLSPADLGADHAVQLGVLLLLLFYFGSMDEKHKDKPEPLAQRSRLVGLAAVLSSSLQDKRSPRNMTAP